MQNIFSAFIFLLLITLLSACGDSGLFNTSETYTDTDKDGIIDIFDTDDDGDGVDDTSDAFPLDASETLDTDGDGIGNNTDTDDDNDGVDDSSDAFPLDATETLDTDSDGIGNNADTDDDNDGEPDVTDIDDDNNTLIEVRSLADLDDIRNHPAGDQQYSSNAGCPGTCLGFELMADLDFDTNSDNVMDASDTYYDHDADGSNNGWLPLGNLASPFRAIFDGNNHSISNLFINRILGDSETNGGGIGLFGVVGNTTSGYSAEIRNLSLTGHLLSITGRIHTGALAGWAQNTTFINCSINSSLASITGIDEITGGLIGAIEDGVINNSFSNGSVQNSLFGAGGLVGYVYNSNISNSYSAAEVSNFGAGSQQYFGGLVAVIDGTSEINDSYASGNLTTTADTVGGLVGYIYNAGTTITNSYATGSVSGSYSIGGLIGEAYTGTIKNSFATGNTSGSSVYVGGLLGYASESIFISSSYATGNVTGNGYAGGLVGSLDYATSPHIISASYATGSVSANNRVGGIIGVASSGDALIQASYASGAISGSSDIGGLLGFVDSGITVNINNSYWASDTTGQSTIAGTIAGTLNDTNTFAALLTELQCPTTANTTACVASDSLIELYTGWDAIDDDDDVATPTIAPWNFGTFLQLPTL